jgi:hypothetical protein
MVPIMWTVNLGVLYCSICGCCLYFLLSSITIIALDYRFIAAKMAVSALNNSYRFLGKVQVPINFCKVANQCPHLDRV